SNLEHGSVAVFIHDKRGKCGGDQLRQVTDPGAEPIVLLGIDGGNTRTDFLDPLEKFSTQPVMYILSRRRSYQPGSTLEKIWFSKFHARMHFPGHGVSPEKAGSRAIAESLLRA